MVKIIGVVTAGGDAPGMNAAIRGVTRIAHAKGFQVIGFERGWDGLLSNSCRKLTPRSVGGIIQSWAEPYFTHCVAQASRKKAASRKGQKRCLLTMWTAW